MKTIFSFFLVSVLGLYCSAQENAMQNNDDLFAMKQALNTENASDYASVFDENATWDGPLGENAIGPENIKRAAHFMFRTFGTLGFAEWKPKRVSADICVVDMYQKVTNGHSNSSKDIPTAPGSIAAAYGRDLRTTLILQKQDKGWRVMAARVADLRLSKAKDIRVVIGEPDNGQYRLTLATLEVQHDTEDGVDKSEDQYVDQLDIENDGTDELITLVAHYEGYGYKIWHFDAKHKGWRKSYEALAGGC